MWHVRSVFTRYITLTRAYALEKKEKYKSLRSENVILVLSYIEDLANFVVSSSL